MKFIRLYNVNVVKCLHDSIINFRLDYGFNIFKDGDHQWIVFHNIISAN